MSRRIIEVDGLSKRYRLGQHNARTLRDEVGQFLRRVRGNFQGGRTADASNLWALHDVSFDVQPGEVLGIIGRNGAGKSTLLKILSRITEPTSGEARIRGRVASLLEVGTGFHPELTGRENVYLNGAILGMTRTEIAAKFDEIVAFAGVDRFLDTPVKRYSSGMYVRLAFAVAAHLEPEVLIVDEVLAVGDTEFQHKCLGRIEQVSGNEGRTVLFVSHNLSAVRRLCKRVIGLSDGRKIIDGDASTAVAEYSRLQPFGRRTEEVRSPLHEFFDPESEAHLSHCDVRDDNGRSQRVFHLCDGVVLTFRVNIRQTDNFHLYVRVFRNDGTLIFATADWDDGEVEPGLYEPGEHEIEVRIPENLLNAGAYVVSVDGLIPSVRYVFRVEHLVEFDVLPYGGVGGIESIQRKGVIRPRLPWRRRRLADRDVVCPDLT